MASCVHLLFLVVFICLYSGRASSFIIVNCAPTSVGQFNQQSMLMCEFKPTQYIPDLKVTFVVWKKTGIEEPVAVFDGRKDPPLYKNLPGYKLDDSALSNKDNRNVSLIITNAKVEQEGEYTCRVITSSGDDEKKTNFKVTAKYNTPTVESIDHKGQNIHKTLICVARGGYPKGQLRWIDENKVEWTKSASQTVNRTENGLLVLSSELPLLKGSTFSEYTCVVYNASGGKEESATITIPGLSQKDPELEKVSGTKMTSTVIAPVVVIGSLIVGLLLALLFVKRRSQQKRRASTIPLMGTHREVPFSDPDHDQPPEYGEVSLA